MKIKSFYRRNFPHYQFSNKYYFVTSRLHNSIPEHVFKPLRIKYLSAVEKLKNSDNINFEYEKYILMKKFFGYYDNYLNRSLSTVNYLSDERIAKIVAESFDYMNGIDFNMLCYCIMPNHFHFLAYVGQLMKPFYTKMQSLKRHTARQSNLILNRTGTFWEEESFDHIVRDKCELLRIIDYIMTDPVRAGLVTNCTDWKWSFCKDINFINNIRDFNESKYFLKSFK